ncbi:MAG: sulfatase-like hydrolase/transferase, partial [Sedimentisphaerales bacterium]|nr:sulfatase-like hydrolase/transferase [Sedimentisphaerales bacterium]
MNRRTFMNMSAAGLASLLLPKAAGNAKETAKQPNILWIMVEDMSPHLSCYGETTIKTPNLDRLAGQGAMFTNCFVTSPVCSPSRSAMITGMYQTTIGAHNHRSSRGQ